MKDPEIAGALQLFERALRTAADNYIAGRWDAEKFEATLDAIRDAFESVTGDLPHWSKLRRNLQATLHSFHVAIGHTAGLRAFAQQASGSGARA